MGQPANHMIHMVALQVQRMAMDTKVACILLEVTTTIMVARVRMATRRQTAPLTDTVLPLDAIKSLLHEPERNAVAHMGKR